MQVWLCNHLPLKFIPPSRFQVNHHTAKLNAKDSINSLLDKHIIKVHERPFLCSPFSVVTNAAGKLRLVLHVITFKYEDLCTVTLMFEVDEYMFKPDLKAGYHQVDTHPEYHKYLGSLKVFFVILFLLFSLLGSQ